MVMIPIRRFAEGCAPGREVCIGLDPAIGTGDDTGLAVAVVLITISVLLALPGSKVMPVADLTFLVFFTVWAAAVDSGDAVRLLIAAVIFVISAIYAGSFTAPVTNEIAQASGTIAEEGASVTHFANGFYPHSLVATVLGKLLGGF